MAGASSLDAPRGKSCVRGSQGGGSECRTKTKPAGARVVAAGAPGGSGFTFSGCGRHGGSAGPGVRLPGAGGDWPTLQVARHPPGLKGTGMPSRPQACGCSGLVLGPISRGWPGGSSS